MSLLLVVNADDFGITEGANRAIIESHLAGSVTSTTLMVNMPAAKHACRLAEAFPSLGVGWHANLTLGRPVSDSRLIPTLVDSDGHFYSRSTLEQKLVLQRVQSADIRKELNAQFQCFLEFGRRPSHIDSHQHMHTFPQVFDAVAEIALRESLPVRLPWPWPGSGAVNLRRFTRSFGMNLMLRRNFAKWNRSLSFNDGFCSVFDIGSTPDEFSHESYRKLLSVYKVGVVELMVHPAEVDLELMSKTRIAAVSSRERDILHSPLLRNSAEQLGYRMVDYRCLSGYRA